MSVSSNLQTQPAWLDTFPDADVAFGFDSTGMWFSGNASQAPYPIRTNYNINSDATVVVIYTFVHTDVDEGCPDQGICFFKADTDPYWSWSDNASRIAVQYNCGNPEIQGQIENEISSPYALTVGETYTARVTYNPVAETIEHELFEGSSATGSPVDAITLTNERLSAGEYRIGFHADLDAALPYKAYFTYLSVSVGPVEAITRVFRALHFPHRRREAVNAVDGAPIEVQPGEMLYGEEENTIYVGRSDGTVATVIGDGSEGGGNYLPLSGGTMTGAIVFDGTSGQYINKGNFDTSRGGNYGISLVCSVGYEFNWQAGWLIATEQDHTTPRPLYLDSGAGSPLRVWTSTDNTGVEISHDGITFSDGTTQQTAGVISAVVGITGASAITNVVKISQTDYDNLAVKDPATMYVIT